MAKRQFQLDETGIRQLRAREQQTGSVAELKRLQAVRLYGSGTSMAQIMDLTGCAESSIREWVQDYKRDGLAGLGLKRYKVRSRQRAYWTAWGVRPSMRAPSINSVADVTWA